MSIIKQALLGYLSWRSLTGYDLKKLVADSELLPWAGNSNQIYTALVGLHQAGWVAVTTEQQASLPPRKVYRLTAGGRAQLLAWLRSTPELPEMRGAFLVQIAWADQLESTEIAHLVDQYEAAVEAQLVLCRESARRGRDTPSRTTREEYLWKMAHENRLRAWQTELEWTRDLRKGLARFRRARRKARGVA